VVASQRFTTSWDRRDSAFNAHRGTYVAGSIEHADAITSQEGADGHFVRLAQTVSAYYPITPKITLAATLRLGEIIQLVKNSVTYPDRFFFMGGFDSMRGWAQDTLFPQDAIDAIVASQNTPKPIDPATIAVRGGNLMFNPRVELRLPFLGPVETVVFVDAGNLWQDARYPFQHGLKLRADAGSGVRIQTPIGPLALDYGVNLTRYSAYEDFGALNFSIGLF
jgi:outer membrane protein assembly factor BamA